MKPFLKIHILRSVALLVPVFANAEEFPNRPINLISPFSAGGGTDLLLRALAPHFENAIKGDVIVSNLSGGSGTVAASALASQEPEGYHLGYWSLTVSTIQPQIKDLPYGVDSWTPICSVAASPTVLFTQSSSPFKTIQEAVEAVKSAPGEYVYGSSGPGAITHLTAVAAFTGLGVIDKIGHLPFQGSAPAVEAMEEGIIHFFGDTELMMREGDFRPLVVFNEDRLDSMPDVPTAMEIGIKAPLNQLHLWGGIFAPAGLSAEKKKTLSTACKTAINSDGFQKFASETNTVLKYRNAEDFDAFYRTQYQDNMILIDSAGL